MVVGAVGGVGEYVQNMCVRFTTVEPRITLNWDCRYNTTTFAVCCTGDPTWGFVHLAKHLTSWSGVPVSFCCKMERCVYAGKEEWSEAEERARPQVRGWRGRM